MLNVKNSEETEDTTNLSNLELELQDFQQLAPRVEAVIRKQRLEISSLKTNFILIQQEIKQYEKSSKNSEDRARKSQECILQAQKEANKAEKEAWAAKKLLAEKEMEYEREKNRKVDLESRLETIKNGNSIELLLQWARGQLGGTKRRPPLPSLPTKPAKKCKVQNLKILAEPKIVGHQAAFKNLVNSISTEAQSQRVEITNSTKTGVTIMSKTISPRAHHPTNGAKALIDSRRIKKMLEKTMTNVETSISAEIAAKRGHVNNIDIKRGSPNKARLTGVSHSKDVSGSKRENPNAAISSAPDSKSCPAIDPNASTCWNKISASEGKSIMPKNSLGSGLEDYSSSESEDCLFFPLAEEVNNGKKTNNADNSPKSTYLTKLEAKDSVHKTSPSVSMSISTSSVSNTSSPSNIPCTAYKEGYCGNGSNCRFAHINRPSCKFFASGTCSFGDKCQLAHNLCKSFYSSGVCTQGNQCKFLHQKKVLSNKEKDPFYKTRHCKFSPCPYGNACTFIHDTTNPPQTFNVTRCRQFQTSGTCTNGNGCKFLHGGVGKKSAFIPFQGNGAASSNQRKPLFSGQFGAAPTMPIRSHVAMNFPQQHPMTKNWLFPSWQNNGTGFNRQKQFTCSVCQQAFQGHHAFNTHLTESGHRKN